MTPQEAEVRAQVAEVIDGVSFRVRDPEEPSIKKYSSVMPGYVIGTTTVENSKAFDRYVHFAEKRLVRIREKIDRQREVVRKFLP